MSLTKPSESPNPPSSKPLNSNRPFYAYEATRMINEIERDGVTTTGNVSVGGDLTVAGTTTLNGNLVLGDAAADSLTVNATTTYEGPINYSNATGITAFAGGGQASATALTEEINNITTVATVGDSVKLPAAVAGKHVYIKNSGATALDVFPATGDSIDALAVNLAIRIQPGSSVDFYAKDATVWESNVDASFTLVSPTTNRGRLELKAADNAANTVVTVTNASQAGADRIYTIPDAGTNAEFVMGAGAQTIAGAKTFTANTTFDADVLLKKEVDHNIVVSASTTANTAGANLTITPAAGNGAANGGDLTLTTGAGGATSGNSGALILGTAGETGTDSSGDIALSTGSTISGASGAINISTGANSTAGGSGGVSIVTGGANTADNSGSWLIATGRALGADSGNVIIQTGLDATNGGDIILKPNENTVMTVSDNTVTMAASTVTKFPDGNIGALPVQFGADGNNGFYGVSDTQLGVAVEGAQVANFDTEGLKADSVQNRVTLGTAGTNCTVKEYGDGRDITTVITLTNVDMGAPTAGAASAVGALIYTFPAGAHCHMVSYQSVGVTIGTVTTDTPDVGVGSVIASGATALLSGTATFEDYITGQTAADAAGTATVKTATATAGALTGISLNEAASAKTVHFNAADTWDAGITGNLLATGTVTLKWTRLSA